MTRIFSGIVAGLASASLLAFAVPAVSGGSCGGGKSASSNDAMMLAANAGGKNIVETAVSAGQFNTLAAALKAAGLIDALSGPGPFTVFAPTDEAFAKLPAGTVEGLLKPENKDKLAAILKYHVVSGVVTSKQIDSVPVAATLQGQAVKPTVDNGTVKINGATVVKADIGATNGVIHVIDSVLLPESKTVPQIAIADGRFTTLVAALKAADLVDTLGGKGPFTVFAPTDDAFAKLPKPLLAALLKPENKGLLTEILTYHVVSGRITSVDAAKAGTAKTLEGTEVTASGKSGALMINGAKVVIQDIDSANGIVHVIDSVLVPSGAAAKIAKLSAASPRDLMELAIARGAPMFNHGDHAACAAVYEVTMNALMALPESSMNDDSRETVAGALAEGARTHSARDRAWVYRRAMDKVMDSSDRMVTR
jgi:uncharacterized surface protein with fasciclin (FAS1) repeats